MNSTRTADRIRTPRNPWGRLITLLVPISILGVVLKLVRIHEFFPTAGIGETAAWVSSDVAFGGAWVLVWTLGCLFTRGRLRTVIFYAAHLATAFVGIFAVLNHEYVLRTGNPLSWATLVDAVQRGNELEAVIGSEVSPVVVGSLIGVVIGVAVLPLVLGPFLSRLVKRLPKHQRKTRFQAVSVVGLVGLLIASGWSAPTASAAFSLAPPLQLAITPVRAANAYPRELATDAATPTPETTRLIGQGGDLRNVVIITLESQRSAMTLQDVKQPGHRRINEGIDQPGTRLLGAAAHFQGPHRHPLRHCSTAGQQQLRGQSRQPSRQVSTHPSRRTGLRHVVLPVRH